MQLTLKSASQPSLFVGWVGGWLDDLLGMLALSVCSVSAPCSVVRWLRGPLALEGGWVRLWKVGGSGFGRWVGQALEGGWVRWVRLKKVGGSGFGRWVGQALEGGWVRLKKVGGSGFGRWLGQALEGGWVRLWKVGEPGEQGRFSGY